MRSRPPLSEIPVVILCGGKGTRLREETGYRPKPMVEIGEQPILWHIMKIYSTHGLGRFVLCLGYLGWSIKEYFLRYHEMHRDFTLTMDGRSPIEYHNRTGDEDWQVTLAETGAETGTGGRLWRVRSYLDCDTFCFTYGDAVGNVDVEALLDFHWSQGRIGTVTGVHPTSRYGEMHVKDGRAVEFNEKPTLAEGVVSGGFFVFQREIFDYLDAEPSLLLELDPLQRLARDGQLSVYLHEGYWHPMDTYRDYLHLNEVWRQGQPPWKTW
ncbi:MAG TPA: glucose-1-phosphate cytidylyltransferase [Thermoanaerobaculia bacterium]|nr:glucose-1-phosphate cytidylyltransferase [Thermoanaerobaculia bacterium]